MRVNLTTRTGSSWSHKTLGRSLPIHQRLRHWRIVLGAMALGAGLIVLFVLWRGQNPKIDHPLSDTQMQGFVAERIARVEVPPWDPGEPLPRTEMPDFPEPDPPRLWREIPRWDETPAWRQDELDRAHRELDAGDTIPAITHYLDLAERSPGYWLPRYDAGVALLLRRDYDRSADVLREANTLSAALPGRGPEYLAARIANERALAAALLPDDCIEAIGHLKTAVRTLGPYRDAADVPVYEPNLPFDVEPTGFDSHQVWLDLVHAYTECPDRYPREYMSQNTGSFVESEYSDATVDEVRNGPFPERLAACIETAKREKHSEPAICWVMSNLNQLYYANRVSYPDLESDDGSAEVLERVDRPATLARLAHAVAWTLAKEEGDRERAGQYLAQARALAQEAEDEDLVREILDLGRYLAPLTGDYVVLAERYRGRSIQSLELDDRSTPEEVKGIAGYVTVRWRRALRNGNAAIVIEEVDDLRRRSGRYGTSLSDWKLDLQDALRRELVAAMKDARDNDNLARALAIRDLEAPYLGEEWRKTAARGWRPYGKWVLWSGGWLFFVIVLWGLYRFVVYPYLVDTTDYYRIELTRRLEAAPPRLRELLEGREIQSRPRWRT